MTNHTKKLSENNPMWKGDRAGIDAIHIWVTARKPKPQFCECCNLSSPIDLANISQKYKRDVKDFEWLCRRCHMKKDGRLNKLLLIKHPENPPIKCSGCGETKKHKMHGCCLRCYDKVRYYWKRRTTYTSAGLPTMSLEEAIKYINSL